jgi:predicted metal-binding membrane protein
LPLLRSNIQLLPLSLLAAVIALAWIFVVWSTTTSMDHPIVMLMMPMAGDWNLIAVTAVFAMWSIMMAAMMLPAVLPMIDAYRRVSGSKKLGATQGGVVYFAAGHLLIWIGFAAVATFAQWWLVRSDDLEPMMIELRSPMIGGAVLAAAGLFQWTPLKYACLSRCRSPLGFLLTEWRPGRAGALVMGIRYGLFCLGCCWALMALLFVFGVMNLAVIIALTAIVILEKIVPKGESLARIIGVVLILFGVGWAASG